MDEDGDGEWDTIEPPVDFPDDGDVTSLSIGEEGGGDTDPIWVTQAMDEDGDGEWDTIEVDNNSTSNSEAGE